MKYSFRILQTNAILAECFFKAVILALVYFGDNSNMIDF